MITGARTYLGIDPGSSASAWAVWDRVRETVLGCGIEANQALVQRLESWRDQPHRPWLAIERPVILGSAKVHPELLETAHWAGVFEGTWGGVVERISYHRVRSHITRDANAKEAAVKQTLISRFAPECRPRKNVGAFALVPTGKTAEGLDTCHIWSAIAVSVTVADKQRAA